MDEPSESSHSSEQAALKTPNDRWTAALRGFGPLGTAAILVILLGNAFFTLLGLILVLLWAKLSRTPWRELGFVPPRSWVATIVGGIIFGVTGKFVMKAIVLPLLGAPPINQAYHFIAGNSAAIPGMLFVIFVHAGFGEEVFFRGYLFERLGKLFGRSVGATVTIVLLSSILFALAHYPSQGMPGAEQALVVGLVFASIFAVTGQIFLLVVTHIAFDLTALAMIYWDIETTVAHLVFK